jgi:hypothetical protein
MFLKPQNRFEPNLTEMCIGWSYTIFSSPGHRPCQLLSWVSVRHLFISFSHLNLLLWFQKKRWKCEIPIGKYHSVQC